jgi:hypothetical protein
MRPRPSHPGERARSSGVRYGSPGLWHAAKRRPIEAHDPATTIVTLRIEPIHDRVDEHPFVPVVLEQDYSVALAKFKLLFPDASRAAGLATEIHFGQATHVEIVPHVRSAVRVGRRILSICHALKASARSVRGRVLTLSIRRQGSTYEDLTQRG